MYVANLFIRNSINTDTSQIRVSATTATSDLRCQLIAVCEMVFCLYNEANHQKNVIWQTAPMCDHERCSDPNADGSSVGLPEILPSILRQPTIASTAGRFFVFWATACPTVRKVT